jgi:hypothetical protein
MVQTVSIEQIALYDLEQRFGLTQDYEAFN